MVLYKVGGLYHLLSGRYLYTDVPVNFNLEKYYSTTGKMNVSYLSPAQFPLTIMVISQHKYNVCVFYKSKMGILWDPLLQEIKK